MTYRQLGNQRRCRRRSGSAGLPRRVPFALLVLSCACVHTSARAHTQEHQAGENTRGCETQEGERDERDATQVAAQTEGRQEPERQ